MKTQIYAHTPQFAIESAIYEVISDVAVPTLKNVMAAIRTAIIDTDGVITMGMIRQVLAQWTIDNGTVRQVSQLLEERNRLNGQLDYITEPAIRKSYIKRLAQLEAMLTKLRGDRNGS